uniref:Predicted protein n=1 Tax=Hordeum vulgare subsp. vulgare TaxID=112509 RepID=F2CYX1_HORVV|nr:predicted protein [Hordeum vulgare subsp. vulgare]
MLTRRSLPMLWTIWGRRSDSSTLSKIHLPFLFSPPPPFLDAIYVFWMEQVHVRLDNQGIWLSARL